MIRHAALTHPGLRRENNEDSLLCLPEQGLFVVADGVGGRAAGEVASALCVEVLAEHAARLAAAVAGWSRRRDWQRWPASKRAPGSMRRASAPTGAG